MLDRQTDILTLVHSQFLDKKDRVTRQERQSHKTDRLKSKLDRQTYILTRALVGQSDKLSVLNRQTDIQTQKNDRQTDSHEC